MDFLQPIAAVGFVLALLGVALVLLKKRGIASFHGSARRMEAIERLALGPHHALHLVRLDGRSMLIATAPGSLQIVGEINGEAAK